MSTSRIQFPPASSTPSEPAVAGDSARHETSSASNDTSPGAVFLVRDEIEVLEGAEVADVPAAVKKAARQGGFVWVSLVNPTEDVVTQARETLGIHPVAAADVVSGRQQPKVQRFAGHLFVLLWQIIPGHEGSDIQLGQTFIYIGEGW